MITNATEYELQKALSIVNEKYENNIRIKDTKRISKNRLQFTLGILSSKAPGHRTSASYFNLGRKVHAACWHVHGDFFDTLFEVNPNAFVRVSGRPARKITKLEGNWEDRNIGPPIQPVMFSEACECNI